MKPKMPKKKEMGKTKEEEKKMPIKAPKKNKK